jgi:predicted nucleotidyltransferase
MGDSPENSISILPENIRNVLSSLVSAAQASFGPDLLSLVLFGSAAEGKLRATSDVNLLFILERFDQGKADSFREPLQVGYAAVKLSAMFVLRSELDAAFEAFAVKFADISERHRVLFGQDLLSGLAASRKARLRALRQSLLNLSMRLRERYMATSLREEQLALVIAEAASPLRSAAAAILDMEGKRAASPKEALETFAGGLGGDSWNQVLQSLSQAREAQFLAPGVAAASALDLMALTEKMRDHVERLT